MANEPGLLQLGVFSLVGAFHKYSGEDGKLDSCELRTLLKAEMPMLFENGDPTEKIFKEVDTNNDKCVDFEEFMVILNAFILCTHEMIQCLQQQQQ